MNGQAKGPWLDGWIDGERRFYYAPVIEVSGRVCLIVAAMHGGDPQCMEVRDTVKLLRAVPDLVSEVLDSNLDEARDVLSRAGVC